MKFSVMVQNAFYGVICFLGVMAVDQIKDLNSQIRMLNQQMTVIVERVTTQGNMGNDHEIRLRVVERECVRKIVR